MCLCIILFKLQIENNKKSLTENVLLHAIWLCFPRQIVRPSAQHDAPGPHAVRRAEEGPPGHSAPHCRSGEGHPGGGRVCWSVPLSVHHAKRIKRVVIALVKTR